MPGNDGEGRVESRVRGGREAILVVGVCSVALGVLVAVWPEKSVPTLELLFGLYLLASGAAQLWLAVGARFALPLRTLVFVSGLLSVLMAVSCLRGGNSVLLLAMWIGLSWTIRGITQATVAAWDDEQLSDSGRHELFGVFTMIVGIVVLVLPLEELDTLGVLVGGCLAVLGGLEIALSGVGRGATVRVPGLTRVPMPRS
ncbi:HdeD family acid-resistance protein [Nocardia amikacinitolerans]|uniref:HdeD family acid-resistance protein n=1 Tax=Nocardia amikacinitolerans TaxID=756689 RepID=UPI000BE2E1CD|nr:DUF308 domain-containing protein [Nocardia amikacinitolerans]